MTPSQLAFVRRPHPPVATVAAVVGLVAAAAWFLVGRQVARDAAERERAAAVERGVNLVTLVRHLAQERVENSARRLSEDTRLKAALATPDIDRTTLLDLLGELHQLDPAQVFAVLTPAGRVRAVLGAPELDGVDLASSAAVTDALARPGAALGAWVAGQRILEVAVASVRVGGAPVGLVLTGVRLVDDDLHLAAQGAGVHVGLLLGDQVAWTSAPGADDAWASAAARDVPVNETAKYVVTAAPQLPGYLPALGWAVLVGTLVFATLAFWRGGAS